MKKIQILIDGSLFVTLLLCAGPVDAQKGKALIKAAKTLSEPASGPSSCLASGAAVQVSVENSLQEAIAQRAKPLDAEAFLEIERGLLGLSKRYCLRIEQEMQSLVSRRIKEPELKENLQRLMKEKNFKEASSLLQKRRLTMGIFPSKLRSMRVLSAGEWEALFKQLDFNRGSDVAKAARLLFCAKDEGLMTNWRYLSALWALEKGDINLVQKIFKKEISANRLIEVHSEREPRLLQSILYHASFADLTPRVLQLPKSSDKTMLLAIRRAIGPLAGGMKLSIDKYKAYYDHQPVWVQDELDRNIQDLVYTLGPVHQQRQAVAEYVLARKFFVHNALWLFNGDTQFSFAALEIIYSPYVPQGLKEELKDFIKLSPEDFVANQTDFIETARRFYQAWTQNRAQGKTFPQEEQDQEFSQIKSLYARLEKGILPAAALAEADQLLTSQDPLMRALAKRFARTAPENKLAEETLVKIRAFVAEKGGLPAARLPLYLHVQYFKDHPNPYQQEFWDIFEKYRRRR